MPAAPAREVERPGEPRAGAGEVDGDLAVVEHRSGGAELHGRVRAGGARRVVAAAAAAARQDCGAEKHPCGERLRHAGLDPSMQLSARTFNLDSEQVFV
jgi:hypothetical protein